VPLVGERCQESVPLGPQLIAAPSFRVEESFEYIHSARWAGAPTAPRSHRTLLRNR
jgi:hypothetical protein